MSLPEDEENRRIFEHFIVAGLSENPEELTPLEHECGNKPNEVLAPITDIVVIFPGFGEKVPPGFTCIETTPSGYPADLNHGSIRTHSAFLCYKRGYHKPPLVDIGIMDEGKKERPMEDSTVIQYTPDGRCANVSNTSSALYFTYRRCKVSGPPHQLVITNIVVVITSKGENPPHTFYKIDKNLNKAMVGSDVFVCYKKAQSCCRRIAYKPAVLDSFPKTDSASALAQNVPMFCLPMGAVIESWSAESGLAEQLFSTCVLTDALGLKYYGASLTFYEKYTKELTEHQKELLSFDMDSKSESDNGENSDSPPKDDSPEQLFFMNKSICIVSRHPFFECFRRFLYYVYLISAMPTAQKIPIERYISHLMYEVPFPTPLRPRVLVQLGEEMIPFENHDDSQVPLSGAQFIEVLKCLGVDNFVYALSLALLEQKILIHSLRPWLLTVVSETICALIFPFHWQCPYIPQCPLALAGVLHAPLPFIAGVDSRYFDLYEDPPGDVTCFDLDTSTLRHSINKKILKSASLPKRPLKHLKLSLEKILERIRTDDRDREKHRRQKPMDGSVDIDQQHQIRKASYELMVREAFLRFMCSVMVGYSSYLKPIKSCPRDENITDMDSRFDLDGFLKSRDRTSHDFYQRFSETQSFIRFIEERSFISDKVVYNAFFDDCIRKCLSKPSNNGAVELLDRDAYSVNHTIVVQPPTILNTKNGEIEYKYQGFPNHFNHELFELDEIKKLFDSKVSEHPQGTSSFPSRLRFSSIRTKQEIRNSIEVANKWTQTYPVLWPRIVLFYGYSLWFLQLPSLLHLAKNKLKILRLAMTVLSRLNKSLVPLLDQVPFRLLMQLCGEYGYPHYAVEVLREMQRLCIEPNAITYGIYHWAVMEGEWPSEARLRAIEAWKRLRLRIEVCVRFAAVRRDPNFIMRINEMHNNLHPQNLNPSMGGTTYSIENMSTLSVDESAVNPSVSSTPEPDTVSGSSRDVKDDEERALEEQPYVITILPLDPKTDDSNSLKSGHDATTTVDPLLAAPLERSNHDKSSTRSSVEMSPSRAQFLREHSASPFAKDIASLDGRISERRRSSRQGASSWFKKFASPVVTNLMRSQTTDDIKVNESGHSASTNELAPPSTIALSPSFSSLFSQVRKQALKGYDAVSQHGNVLLKKSGVNSLVNEVKNLNKSYSKDSSFIANSSMNEDSMLNGTTVYQDHFDSTDPAFQLDTGTTGNILMLDYWMQDLVDENSTDESENETEEDSYLIDAILCSCTSCPRCNRFVYDEELISGWSVDDSNLNTVCPFCHNAFAPSLKVKLEPRVEAIPQSYYSPLQSRNYTAANDPNKVKIASETLSVPFVSALVLRREIETLLANDVLALADSSLRTSHPVIFWNLIYYLRRLDLPTHMYTWISKNVQIRCVYDCPERHNNNMVVPLYITNHAVYSFFHKKNLKLKMITKKIYVAFKNNIQLEKKSLVV